MPQVKLAAVLKATGLNILRAMEFKNRMRRQEKREKWSNPSPNGHVGNVKEQFYDCRPMQESFPRDSTPATAGSCASRTKRSDSFCESIVSEEKMPAL
jgi:hypothetical protein